MIFSPSGFPCCAGWLAALLAYAPDARLFTDEEDPGPEALLEEIGITPAAPSEAIVPLVALDDVVAEPTEDGVRPVAAQDDVVARAAIDRVVAVTALQRVVAAEASSRLRVNR